MASSSYRQILKSAGLTGGASVINVLLGIVRTKLLAVVIGADGIGLLGLFNSITSLVSLIAGMGISTSGVRQIAEAVGSNDLQRVARTVHVLRRTSFVVGLLGMLVLLLLCRPISQASFGNTTYAGALALLSLTILFTAVAGGQTALIQGCRRLRDLAASSIWGGLLATAVTLPIVYFCGEKGIVPFIVATSALTIGTSWWYARKIKVGRVSLPVAAVWSEAKVLLGLGVAFMATGLIGAAVAYLIRVLVIRQMNLEAVGLYQAACTLSLVYAQIILTAMGADYYPRLTTLAGHKEELNRLINEQTEAALLMAIPGILATLTFAPWVIHLAYSARFAPALDILRWQILGVLGQVMFWPLGYVFPALGCAKLFVWIEASSKALLLGLSWLGMTRLGLSGLGLAYLGMYVFYGLAAFTLVHRLSRFEYTKANVRLGVGAIILAASVYLATAGILPPLWGVAIGGTLTGAAGVYAVRKMSHRTGYRSLASVVHGIRVRIRAGIQ